MTRPLYVVAGQSNAVRLERYESVEEAIIERDSDAKVIHVSQGGTSLSPRQNRNDWYPFEDNDPNTGELYVELVSAIGAELATGEYHLAGILWLQDGADANERDAPNYETNLQGLVDGLRGEFGDDFTFTIVETSEVTPGYQEALESGDFSDARFEFGETISDAQNAVADRNDNVTLLNTVEVWTDAGLPELGRDGEFIFEDNTFEDAVHFNDPASDAIGEAFIAQFDAPESNLPPWLQGFGLNLPEGLGGGAFAGGFGNGLGGGFTGFTNPFGNFDPFDGTPGFDFGTFQPGGGLPNILGNFNVGGFTGPQGVSDVFSQLLTGNDASVQNLFGGADDFVFA
ncbi:MAG: sialate O-acetylesterase [Pseudomonadota bacterium]